MPHFFSPFWFVKVFLSSVPAQASYPLPKLFLSPLLWGMVSCISSSKVHWAFGKRKLQRWWNNIGLSKTTADNSVQLSALFSSNRIIALITGSVKTKYSKIKQKRHDKSLGENTLAEILFPGVSQTAYAVWLLLEDYNTEKLNRNCRT